MIGKKTYFSRKYNKCKPITINELPKYRKNSRKTKLKSKNSYNSAKERSLKNSWRLTTNCSKWKKPNNSNCKRRYPNSKPNCRNSTEEPLIMSFMNTTRYMKSTAISKISRYKALFGRLRRSPSSSTSGRWKPWRRSLIQRKKSLSSKIQAIRTITMKNSRYKRWEACWIIWAGRRRRQGDNFKALSLR